VKQNSPLCVITNMKDLDLHYPNVPRIVPKIYKIKHKDIDIESTVFFELGMSSWWAKNIEYWYEESTKTVAFDIGTGKATEEPCLIKHVNKNLSKN